MKTLAIVYTTTTGNTAWVAGLLHQRLRQADLLDATTLDLSRLAGYDCLVFCVSTWGRSEMQDDWERLAAGLARLDLAGKPVAILGLGDQKHYPEAFADGMRRMASLLEQCGARLCGLTGTQGYSFVRSLAVESGRFLGLVLDEENQAGLSPERLEAWAAQLTREFGLYMDGQNV